jgi:carbamate kinase
MKIVVAVGGNALLRRREAATAENQLHNVAVATRGLAAVAREHELVVVHGNGPQVGLLALQAEAYAEVPAYPLDMLGAESVGLVGYLLEQGIANHMMPPGIGPHVDRSVTTLLTRVEVDADDLAFDRPSKPIGPLYPEVRAQALARERGWAIAREDHAGWRRVVPSPAARALVDVRPILWLLERGSVVICGGGGGIPVVRVDGAWHGVEAVVDKDDCAQLIATSIDADALVIATDVSAVQAHWGTPSQHPLQQLTTRDLSRHTFAPGSMQPKVRAACAFADRTGKPAAIGALEDIEALVRGETGTRVLPV